MMVKEAKRDYPKGQDMAEDTGRLEAAIERVQAAVQDGLARLAEIRADVVALREALIGLRNKPEQLPAEPVEPPPAA